MIAAGPKTDPVAGPRTVPVAGPRTVPVAGPRMVPVAGPRTAPVAGLTATAVSRRVGPVKRLPLWRLLVVRGMAADRRSATAWILAAMLRASPS